MLHEQLKDQDDVFIENVVVLNQKTVDVRGKVRDNDCIHKEVYVEYKEPLSLKTQLDKFSYHVIRIA